MASEFRLEGPLKDTDLRRDSVEELAGDRDAVGGQVREEGACYPETLVDLVGTVDLGVVDQALPADGGTRLLPEMCRQRRRAGADSEQTIVPSRSRRA